MNDIAKVAIAGREQSGRALAGQLVWSDVTATAADKRQWTKIEHEMVAKKISRIGVSIRKEFPEPKSADLRARTIESEHWPLRMLAVRPADFGVDLEPIAHGINFSKRDSGLCHPKRPW